MCRYVVYYRDRPTRYVFSQFNLDLALQFVRLLSRCPGGFFYHILSEEVISDADGIA